MPGPAPVSASRGKAQRLLLWLQGLSDPLPRPEDACRRIVAVQSQYPASVAPALAARSPGCAADWPYQMVEGRAALKGWLMRQTVHFALPEEYSLALSAVGPALARYHRHVGLKFRGLGEHEYEGLQHKTLEALRQGPMGRDRLHQLVPEWKQHENLGWGFDVRGLAVRGLAVMTRQAAARTEFVAAEAWIGAPVPQHPDPWPALVRRYLAAHAPATANDFAAWAGIYPPDARQALAGVPEAVPVRVEGEAKPRYALPGQLEPLADPPPPPRVRLLPKFDALLMGHKDRGLVLPEEQRRRVVRPAGQIEAVVLADSVVAGTWRLALHGIRARAAVQTAPPPSIRARRAAEDEVARIAHNVAAPAAGGRLPMASEEIPVPECGQALPST